MSQCASSSEKSSSVETGEGVEEGVEAWGWGMKVIGGDEGGVKEWEIRPKTLSSSRLLRFLVISAKFLKIWIPYGVQIDCGSREKRISTLIMKK